MRRLTLSRKLLLPAVGLTAMAALFVIELEYARGISAQSQAEQSDALPIHFEVVSIRQNLSSKGHMTFDALDDGVAITGAPVVFLVQQAFGVEADRILGLPAWTKTDFYDIQAKVDDADVSRWKALTISQSKVAFQALLATRFNLRTHPETRVHPVYSLVVAKNGRKFHEATPGDTYPNGLKKPDGSPLGPAVIMGVGRITIQGGSIATLVKLLSNQDLGYPIEDRTGLTGQYDLTLQWTPGNLTTPGGPGPSLFTALEEQLGLKLEFDKKPVEMIVVDHIDRPSPN